MSQTGRNGPSHPPGAAGTVGPGASKTPNASSGSRRPAGISGASRGSKA